MAIEGLRVLRRALGTSSDHWKKAWRLLPALALGLSVWALASPPAGAVTGAMLYVNAGTGTDSGTCGSTTKPCATISYALAKAASGATIRVAAGTYPQQLGITKSVTIDGAGSGTVIQPTSVPTSDTDTDSTNPQYPIVDVNPGADGSHNLTGVKIENLSIDGSDAQDQFTGCLGDYVGVYYHDASGSLSHVSVTGIDLPPALFGCQDGQGVYVASDAGQTYPTQTGGVSTVSMNYLTVSTFDKNAITCDDPGTSCTIEHSTTTGDGPIGTIAQNGVQAFGAQSLLLHDSTVSDDSYTGGGAGNSASGVLILNTHSVNAYRNNVQYNDVNVYAGWVPDYGLVPSDGEGTWSLTHNTVENATDNVPGGYAQYGDGIQVDSVQSGLSVEHNTVGSNAENGIALYGASGVTVKGNTIQSNRQNGIYLGANGSVPGSSSSDHVQGNASGENVNDGILADTGSSSDTFTQNTLGSNGVYGAQDLGTSNSWVHDHCTGTGGSPATTCS